ncbi:MAG: DUF4167 domain-containing protein [Proteobacteria bacterium]|nr:DUF4167 domain-containing protein [Pseudomonadota bacterium]
MRQGSNGRRPRGRPHRKQHGGAPRHNNFDSNGPEGRVRGNAHQVYEKYIGLARDALSLGDRVAAENYYQYAEHYYRVLNARTDPRPNGEDQPGRQSGNSQAEAAGVAARGGIEGQAPPVAGTGEQPREAAPADAQPMTPPPPRQPPAKARRRPKAASAEEPEPEAGPSEDSEPAET